MKKASFYGWKLLAAFWFIYLVNLGYPTYGSSVVNAYMATSLHLDRAMLGLAFSVYMLMVGLPGPVVAVIVNRIGVRWTLLIGSCSSMAGGLALALVRSHRLAGCDRIWCADRLRIVRGRRDRRASRNRAVVCAQASTGAVAYV